MFEVLFLPPFLCPPNYLCFRVFRLGFPTIYQWQHLSFLASYICSTKSVEHFSVLSVNVLYCLKLSKLMIFNIILYQFAS